MTFADPGSAPPRPDLVFLRRRARAVPVALAPAVAPAPEPAPPAPAGVPPAGAPASLDLGAAVPPAPAPPATGPSLLDLSAPEPGPPAHSAAAPAARATPRRSAPAAGPAVRRVRVDRPEVLTPKAPVATLSRVQSGIGVLTIQAACSEAVGNLRLGCAYRLRNGLTSVVQHASGITVAPAGSTRPILVGDRGRFEIITLDLGQVREVDRLLFYAFSASGVGLEWGGTLIFTTFGGARVEVPMDGPRSHGVVGLATVYNVDGELVIRAEPRELSTTVRDACLAFGFDRISWLDPHTPAA